MIKIALFRTWKRIAISTATAMSVYVITAYAILPAIWRHHEHQPGLADHEMVTRTPLGIPGDPLNIGLVGEEDDLVRTMSTAGWSPADPVTLRSSARIIGSVLLNRPDPTAPVSRLLYQGRREDLAFELTVGRSARQRHHVRFWKVLVRGAEGRPVWLGAATFDRGVGLSRDTGQVTHLIAPDIDSERDYLASTLNAAHQVVTQYQVSGVEPTLDGRNGGGNLYRTDGEIRMMVLTSGGETRTAAATSLQAPPLVEVKDAILHPLTRSTKP